MPNKYTEALVTVSYSSLQYSAVRSNSPIIPEFEAGKLTEVQVTFVAFDLIHSSTVQQLKAVKGEVVHLAQSHPPLQAARPWDARTGTGWQSGRLGSFLELSHGSRFSWSKPQTSSKPIQPANLGIYSMFICPIPSEAGVKDGFFGANRSPRNS